MPARNHFKLFGKLFEYKGEKRFQIIDREPGAGCRVDAVRSEQIKTKRIAYFMAPIAESYSFQFCSKATKHSFFYTVVCLLVVTDKVDGD